MAKMKRLSSILDELRDLVPNSDVEVQAVLNKNSGEYSELVITIRDKQDAPIDWLVD